jgi:hypothetical protein
MSTFGPLDFGDYEVAAESAGRIAARVIEQLVVREPLTMRTLIDETKPCRWFASIQGAAT